MPNIVDLNPIPNRATRPDTIDDDADQFFGKLPSWGDMMLAMYSGTLAASAGGVYAIPYTYDSNITNADPGAGKLRFNAATQSAATVLYIDLVNTAGTDVSGLLDQMDASTSLVRGKLRLVKASDPLKWLTFDVTARTPLTGYRAMTVSGAVGSAANPFTNGDLLLMYFERTGDRGQTGYTSYMKVSDKKAQGLGGGSSNGSLNIRALNTIDWNDIAGASLANNQVTLPAGTYEVFARAPMYNTGSPHQLVFQNVTDAAPVIIGAPAYAATSAQSDSILFGQFTITATKVFQLNHYNALGSATNNGLGLAYGIGMTGEFAALSIKKVAN